MFYGLSKLQSKKLAYKFAIAKGKRVPTSWEQNKSAGEDWLIGFRERNKELSLRKPEATSLARAMAFHRENVGLFFKKLAGLVARLKIEPHMIWNLDETGVNTVVPAKQILGQTGCKQIGQIRSGERGENITICACISAVGQSLPPAFIFPRVHFKEHMLNGAPPGSFGLANSSGWMKNELFPAVLKHFHKYIFTTKESPGILIMDNHNSHLALEAIDFARDNGIHLLTFPLHCSHRMQPLDVSVFGPFKCYYSLFCDAWHKSNPGKPLTIYHVADVASKAIMKSFSQENILSGFKCTGIYPLNPEVFTDDQYLPSMVTDAPLCSHNLPEISEKGSSDKTGHAVTMPSAALANTPISSSDPDILTEISPFPKSEKRLVKSSRKRVKCAVITDTPEKERLHPIKESTAKKARVVEKTADSSSDSDESLPILSDTDEVVSSSDSEQFNDVSGFNMYPTKGQFVVAEVFNDKNCKLFVGKVISDIDNDGDYEVAFLHRSTKIKNGFVFPDIEDIASVPKEHIKKILPEARSVSTTKRLSNILRFSADLSFI